MKDMCTLGCRDHTTRMQGTRAHGFQLVARLLPAQQPRDPMSAGSSAAGKLARAKQLHMLAGDGREAVRSRCSSSALAGWIISFRILTVRRRGAAAAVGTALSTRWGSTTKCAFGTTKGAPKGEAVQCLCAHMQRRWRHEESKRH